jgi:hypothetical protein
MAGGPTEVGLARPSIGVQTPEPPRIELIVGLPTPDLMPGLPDPFPFLSAARELDYKS